MKVQLRDAFGAALVDVASAYSFIVVDADNAKATRLSSFAASFPNRFVNVGCAEQNLVGVCAGIASTGLSVVASTFSVFLTGRAFEQIRNAVCQGGYPVVLVGTHAGITVGHDGPSHFSLEDLALMRSLTDMRVLVASTPDQVRDLLIACIASQRPCYLRISREATESRKSRARARIGGSSTVASGRDLVIVTCGVCVDRALEARRRLAGDGISACVIDAYSIKPLDRRRLVEVLKRVQAAVVVEEHAAAGGLGEAVMGLAAACRPMPIEHVCVRDTFATSGAPSELLDAFGLSVERILEAAHMSLARASLVERTQ